MPFPKKWIPVLSFLTVGFVVWLFKPLLPTPRIVWDIPADQNGNGNEGQGVRLGVGISAELSAQVQASVIRPQISWNDGDLETIQVLQQARQAGEQKIIEEEQKANHLAAAAMPFKAGIPKAVGETYTKALIVARTKEEDVLWIEENFGGNDNFKAVVYTVDDFDSEYHPLKNKGHEVMVYLSYIIDNYDNLSDFNIFMHSHRYAWHNDELLEHDAVQMISRLSSERVAREGFMNMRCHWDPGCPSWMHPGTVEEDINKQEETILARSWSELFPVDPIPNVLAQPCCAQFAVSKARIRSLPLARYVFYRDWLLRTSLSDYISGRVWEYVWQFVFTGQNVVCPKEHVCYCDGFGVCFGGEEQYDGYYKRHNDRVHLEEELNNWNNQNRRWEEALEEKRNNLDDPDRPERPEVGKDLELQGRISALNAWCHQTRQEAKEHGDVAMNRAREVGRPWVDGDGF